MTNVAIYGGAFNPITISHVQVIHAVLDHGFDQVWLMPTFKHRFNKVMESSEHRLKMCELVADTDKRIHVFDYEIKHQLSNGTYDFINRLKQENELMSQNTFSMVIGLDNANIFDKWANFELLKNAIPFVVVSRPGYEVIPNSWYLNSPHTFIQVEISQVSSTVVREIIKRDIDASKKFLFKEVWDYILNNNLYA
mgnify:CR=1 FL=1